MLVCCKPNGKTEKFGRIFWRYIELRSRRGVEWEILSGANRRTGRAQQARQIWNEGYN